MCSKFLDFAVNFKLLEHQWNWTETAKLWAHSEDLSLDCKITQINPFMHPMLNAHMFTWWFCLFFCKQNSSNQLFFLNISNFQHILVSSSQIFQSRRVKAVLGKKKKTI